jgi:arylsulfatase A-like enzyme
MLLKKTTLNGATKRLRLRVSFLALLTTALLISSQDQDSLAAEDGRSPNLIFIMADDLGYGDLGCFGQEKIKTPTLDKLAANGLKFNQFYAGSTVCAPSRCVLMTGYDTGRAFIRGNGKDNLRPSDVTVAEVLKAAGYKTGLFGKWGLGHEGSAGIPTKQGFDEFFGYLDQHHAHNYYPTFLVDGDERVQLKNEVPKEGEWGQGVATKKVEYSHNLVMDRALKFVKESKNEPFFLYLSLTIPHANNEAGGKGMEIPDQGDYTDLKWPEPQRGHAAMISKMDRDIGTLVATLEELKIDKQTLIFFTSDNGPHAEGGNDPDFNNSNGPLKGIKRSLHEGGIRVPTIAYGPGMVPAGKTTEFAGGFWDIMPTFAELAGKDAVDAVPSDIDGISFAATLLGNDGQKQHDHLYWAFYERGGARALRMGDWKAIQQPINTPVRLYNLAIDLGEETNVAKEHPEVVEKMTKIMDAEYEPSDRWKFPKQ